MEKLFVSSSLAVAVLTTIAFSPASNLEKARKQYAGILPGYQLAKPSDVVVLDDTLPANTHIEHITNGKSGAGTYHITRNGKRYEFVEKNGVISSLAIDGKQIPKDQIASYKPELDKIIQDIKEAQRLAELDRKQAEKSFKQAELSRKQAEQLRGAAEKEHELAMQAKEKVELAQLKADLKTQESQTWKEAQRMHSAHDADLAYKKAELQLQMDQLRAQADRFRDESALEVKKAKAQQEKFHAENFKRQKEVFHQQAEHMKLMVEQDQQLVKLAKIQAEQAQLHAQLAMKQAEQAKTRAEEARIYFEKTTRGVIDDLLEDGIVNDKNGLSFKLSNEALEVNGVKQPESVHRKFKTKYIDEEGLEIIYNHNGRTGISKMAR